MLQLRQYVSDFSELFSGSKESYGVHVPEKVTKTGEKAKGKSFTKTEPLTDPLYLKHLHGEQSLGVVPVDKDGMVSFAAIDIDEYPLNPVKYLTMIKKANLPVFGLRSKSGGLHLYCFFDNPAPAPAVIAAMNQIRELLGLKPTTEIFPKQTAIQPSGGGNWINLPYFNADKTSRYAYSQDGKPLPLSTFLSLAKASRTSPKGLSLALDAAPLSQAPPCLQRLFLQGGAEQGERNNFMLNCGVYLKARFGEAFADNLHLLNNNTNDPIDYVRLDTTAIASLNKKDYNYACKSPLLVAYCDRESCSGRKYGVGGQFVSDFTYGQLRRYKGDDDDEYYTWEVDDQLFTLYGIQDLMNQNRFRALCGSKLNKIPNRLKENVWLKKINEALANVLEEDDKIGTGMSDKEHWIDKVGEFFAARRAIRKEQLLEGLVWLYNDKLFFKTSTLQEHLLQIQTLRGVSKIQHRQLLKDYGVYRGSVRIKGNPMGFSYVLLSEQQQKGRLFNIHANPERLKKKQEKHAKAQALEGVIDFTEEEKF